MPSGPTLQPRTPPGARGRGARRARSLRRESGACPAEGRGEAEPRASNDSEAGRAANRRVEILITSTA